MTVGICAIYLILIIKSEVRTIVQGYVMKQWYALYVLLCSFDTGYVGLFQGIAYSFKIWKLNFWEFIHQAIPYHMLKIFSYHHIHSLLKHRLLTMLPISDQFKTDTPILFPTHHEHTFCTIYHNNAHNWWVKEGKVWAFWKFKTWPISYSLMSFGTMSSRNISTLIHQEQSLLKHKDFVLWLALFCHSLSATCYICHGWCFLVSFIHTALCIADRHPVLGIM